MIQFLSPAFLFAAVLIAIPIIIHLFNFRRFRKVFFTNVRFLKEIKQETTSRSRLRHLLVLCCRILAVLFLVFAFARPVIPLSDKRPGTGTEPVSIYIDNSFSMEAVKSEGTLLDIAKSKAKDIVNAYPPSAKFQLLTADFDPVHQRLLSREEFLDMSEQVKISGNTKSLNDIISRQHEALSRAGTGNGVHYILSDFQSNMYHGELKKDSAEELVFMPVQADRLENIYIDSCWMGAPAVQLNQPAELFFRIVNDGDENAENIPVKVAVDKQTRSVATISVEAGKSAIGSVNFTINQPGWHTGEVSISDHPVTFDDIYYFSFEVKQFVSVLALNGSGESPFLNALFGRNPLVKLTNSSYTQVDYSTFKSNQLLVLNEIPQISSGLAEEINKYLRDGGHVIFFPDSAADISSYNSFLSVTGADIITGINSSQDKVVRLDKNNELFADVFQQNVTQDASVDYPVAFRHFDLGSNTGSNRQVIMQLQGGGSFLSQYNSGKGSLYVFSVPLQPGFSNLARHAVFVPAMYRMALLSLKGHDISFVTGEDVSVTLKNTAGIAEGALKVTDDKGNEVIPQSRTTSAGLDVNLSFIKDAGHYVIRSGNNILTELSFNYSRNESEMRMMNPEQLALLMKENQLTNASQIGSGVADLAKHLKQLTEGISLWKYCIIAVLIFLLAETLLLRFWKT